MTAAPVRLEGEAYETLMRARAAAGIDVAPDGRDFEQGDLELPVLVDLTREGLVENVGLGRWRLTEPGATTRIARAS